MVAAQQTSASLMATNVVSAAPSFVRAAPSPDPYSPGSISGTVKDLTGVEIPGARITLATESSSQPRTADSASDGVFIFSSVVPGPYTLTVAAPGLAPWSTSDTLLAGQNLNLAHIAMAMPITSAVVEVVAARDEVAAAQIHLAEQQRVLGVIPNFYASYIWNAAPLTRKQKFSLAWKFTGDPVNLFMAAVVAGTEQSSDTLSGYGQGTRGYARRFGATYADGFTSTMLGQAILPSLLHQDPRYFVKGTGSIRSRALYSISTIVICKGDNGRWQPNYSNVLGNLGASAISNIYYPASSRHGAGLTIQNSLIGTAFGATGNLIQEFLLHHLTPNLPNYNATN